jgi:hypothetical protein
MECDPAECHRHRLFLGVERLLMAAIMHIVVGRDGDFKPAKLRRIPPS